MSSIINRKDLHREEILINRKDSHRSARVVILNLFIDEVRMNKIKCTSHANYCLKSSRLLLKN